MPPILSLGGWYESEKSRSSTPPRRLVGSKGPKLHFTLNHDMLGRCTTPQLGNDPVPSGIAEGGVTGAPLWADSGQWPRGRR